MQVFRIITTCDLEEEEEEERGEGEEVVEGTEVVWMVDDELLVLDVCERHMNSTTVSEMDKLVRKLGRPLAERRAHVRDEVSKKRGRLEKKKSKDAVCPWPDCSHAFKNLAGLYTHFRRSHGESLGVYRLRLTGEEPKFKCTCGDVFATRPALTSHAYAMTHRRKIKDGKKHEPL